MTTAAVSTSRREAAPRSGLNSVYLRTEIRRAFRNPRFAVFTIVMPLAIFFVFAPMNSGETLDGLNAPAYLMVSMGVFGAMGAVMSAGGRISLERSINWHRQLRLTGLTGGRYVATKVLVGFALAVPSLVLVYLAATLTQDVHLPLTRMLAAGASTLLALLPLAVLGILLGYSVPPDSLQALMGGLSFLLSLVGGIWVPVETMPDGLADLARSLPVYWVTEAGREPLTGSWLGWHGVAVLAAWTVGLGLIAAKRYRADAKRA